MSRAVFVDKIAPVLDAWGKYKRYEPAVSAIRTAIAELPPALVQVTMLIAYWEPDPAAGYTCSGCRKWHAQRERYCNGCGAKMELEAIRRREGE